MKAGELTDLDGPKSLIGQSVVRPNARRHTEGRGRYLDDIVLGMMSHAAFLRSPHAHAKIVNIDTAAAVIMPGVLAVVTGAEIAARTKPYVGVLSHLKGLRSAPQYPLALDFARWQGEPIAVVVAKSRAEAEDALEAIDVTWEVLPATVDMERALDPSTPVIHPDFGSNLCFQKEVDTGGVDDAFAKAHLVVEDTLQFGRHTGVPLKSRAIIASYHPSEEEITIYHSHQSIHMMRSTFSTCLSLEEHKVRVIAPDIGGGFGIKVHTYGDEIAICVMAMMLGRPVKFVADRLESFLSDIHARDHRVTARMAFDAEGNITALDLDDLTGIGPFSMFPRTSAIECNQVVNLTGGPYKHKAYRAKGTVVFQNKNMMCQYRGVGHPIAITTAEHLMDLAAAKLGLDPAEIRRRNLIPDNAYPYTSPSGMRFEILSHQHCLEHLLKIMDYDGLRELQREQRERGVYLGIGLSCFFEITNPSPMFYGVGGASIGSQEGCDIKLNSSGAIIASTGISELGQGAETIVGQIAASSVGVGMHQVKVILGDTDTVPHGSGSWASRQTGIVGEAVLQAGRTLRQNILGVAAVILKTSVDQLDIEDGVVIRKGSNSRDGLPLKEVARIVYYRGNELPMDCQPNLMATHQYRVKEYAFVFANGTQGSLVEVDPDTGFVKLLKLWCVDNSRAGDQSETARRANSRGHGAGYRGGSARTLHL